MRAELLHKAAELSRRGEPYVLATVVWRQAPSSAQRGDSALVTADGAFLYVVGAGANMVSVFSVDGGNLTEIAASPVAMPSGGTPFGLVVI